MSFDLIRCIKNCFRKKREKQKKLPLYESELLNAVNYLAKYGDNNVFPKPFEYEIISNKFEQIKKLLIDPDYIFNSQARKFRHIFLPKRLSGFRIYHQLDPFQSIIFFALVKKISSKIERKRIPVENNIVFSHRLNLKNDGLKSFYDKRYSYKTFNERTLSLLGGFGQKYIIFTDISDFYMRIYHHDLENSLFNMPNTNSEINVLIKKLLREITNNETIGIPIGPEASHLLAELVINEIDQILVSKGIVFCRYSDDFRIFCDDYYKALKTLEFFTEELYCNLKLTINPLKTKILNEIDAINFINKTTDEYLPYQPSDEDLKEFRLNKLQEDYIGNMDSSDLSDDDIEKIKNQDLSVEIFDFDNLKTVNAALYFIKLAKDGKYAEKILDNINKYLKLIKPICAYFKNLNNLTTEQYNLLKKKYLSVLETSFIASSKYRKMLLLNVLVNNPNLVVKNGLIKNYNEVSDLEKREIILILHKLNNQEFFNAELKRIQYYCNPWVRRALFYGAQCISQERRSFIRKNNPDMDEFEKIILNQ